MKLINRLRIAKILIQLVLNPKRTELIFQGVKIVSDDGDQKIFAAIEKNFEGEDDFHELYRTKYNPYPPTLEELSRHPEGTFGNALCQHLVSNQLTLGIFPRFEWRRPVEYLSLRIYQDHDLWHALLGYGVDLKDELALQAFGIAQTKSPISTLLVAGGLLHLLWKSPLKAVEAFHEVCAGYNRGAHARLLVGIRLHDLFDQPLHQVQQLCGVLMKAK